MRVPDPFRANIRRLDVLMAAQLLTLSNAEPEAADGTEVPLASGGLAQVVVVRTASPELVPIIASLGQGEILTHRAAESGQASYETERYAQSPPSGSLA